MKTLLLILKYLLLFFVLFFSIDGFSQTKEEIDRFYKSEIERQEKNYEEGQLKAIHGKWQLKSVYMNQRTFYRDKIAEHVKEEYKLVTANLKEPMSDEDSKKYLKMLEEYLIDIFKLSYEFAPYRFYFQNGLDGKVKFNTNKDEMTLTWTENGKEQSMPWSITQLDKRTLVLTTMTRFLEPKVYTFNKK
ncbi:MAG: hypothetical protein WC389_11330 [Lutibacter sp.]|jgi:hypothetical protein